MATDQIDRIDGVVTSAAIKYPVRVATTAPITLLGLQTVDGVALADGDRILVKDQADHTQNGIYNVSASVSTNWVRAIDFDGVRDATDGTFIYVRQGTVSQNLTYRAVCGDNPIIFGTSLITFVVAVSIALSQAPAHTFLGNNTGSTGAVLNLTATQLTAELNPAVPGTKGLVPAAGAFVRGYISDLTLSTAGGSGTMTIAAGIASDSTNTAMMNLVASISKTTAAWAVGSGNGGLDTGVIANNTWYHFHEITRVDTGVVDVLFSLSVGAPTLPASYTLFRRIGSRKTDGSGHWISFSQNGDEVLWTAPVLDMNAVGALNSGQLVSLTVPPGVKVWAEIELVGAYVSLSTAFAFWALDGNQAQYQLVAISTSNGYAYIVLRTNTSGQVGWIASAAGGATISLTTLGFIDRRGKDS